MNYAIRRIWIDIDRVVIDLIHACTDGPECYNDSGIQTTVIARRHRERYQIVLRIVLNMRWIDASGRITIAEMPVIGYST